jgi:hypothetical protein
MKHLGAQREMPPANRTMCPVFNEEKTRNPPAASEGTPITQHSWRRFDGNVWAVTQLHLTDLGAAAPFGEVFE